MMHARSFSSERESVGAARRFVTEALSYASTEVLESVQLMVSELATNCVRHAHTAFDLAVIQLPAEIRIEVTDHAGGTPAMRHPAVDEPTGRGLLIVNMLSENWGVEPRTPTGKTVWFTVAAPVAASQCRA
jgi:anti-sigma regulatory factor (Ser/Thr protein kinase)